MRSFILVFFLSAASVSFSQENELEAKIDRYKQLIQNSKNGERLVWMDSLALLLRFNTSQKYDSIAKSTIQQAFELDSVGVAAKHIADLIYYYDARLGNYDSSLEVFEKHKASFTNMTSEEVSNIYLEMGDVAKFNQRNELAVKLLDSAYHYAVEAKSLANQSSARLYQAQIYASEGKFIDAFEKGRMAESFFYEAKDTSNLIATKILLSVLYSQQDFFEESNEIRLEGIELAKKTEAYTSLVLLYNNMSSDYGKQDDQQQRIKYGKLALETNKKNPRGDFLEIMLLAELSKKYADNDSLELAKKYLDEINSIAPIDSLKGTNKIAAEEAYGYYFLKKGLLNEALELWLQNYEQEGKQIEVEGKLNSEEVLAEIYEKLGKPRKQAIHLKNYIHLSDSINSAKNRKTLTYFHTRYETEKRDNQISAQLKDLALLEEKDKIKNQWILFGALSLFGVFGGILLYRSRNNYKRRQLLQEQFTQDIMNAQEEERNRVAKDLHDGVGQQLTLIKRKAQNLHQEELASMTSNTLDEVRSISRALYPPMLKKLGLTKSINQTLFDLDEETELFISAEVDPEIDGVFQEDETLNFYRFIQEGVNNVMKHSKATTLEVIISKEENKIEALIRDNGVGFNNIQKLTQNSLGLKTMTERIKGLGGKLSIKSQEGEGTWVLAEIHT